MSFLIFFKNFWLDFFSAYYNRLMKNAKYETSLSNLLHLSFVQAINFNSISVLVLHFLFKIKLNFLIIFSPIVILSLINIYYFYYRLDIERRNELIKRRPKYKRWFYDLYDLISTILFVLILILLSQNK